jgi:hypothetical protein
MVADYRERTLSMNSETPDQYVARVAGTLGRHIT